MKFNLLRDERKQRGWSQAYVAEALGITTKTVIRWELGHAVPFPYNRHKLSALFGKTAEELGLLSEGDENDVFKQTVSPLVPSSVSHVPVQAPFLADPAIPMHLESADTLGRRDSLLTLMQQSLLAGDTVLVAALEALPRIGKTALALAVVTDRQVQAHFHHGILWAQLGFHPNVLGVLARWGQVLGISPNPGGNPPSPEARRGDPRGALCTPHKLRCLGNTCQAA